MIVPDAGIADQGGSNGHDVCALRCIERSQAMPKIQRIAPCLWFDDQAEQAAGAERQNAELLFPRFTRQPRIFDLVLQAMVAGIPCLRTHPSLPNIRSEFGEVYAVRKVRRATRRRILEVLH